MEGNQKAEPFGALMLELPTKTGLPKLTDGPLVAVDAMTTIVLKQ